MTPEPAPTMHQLLAFYLEAGVDCALADEPVNRLADSDLVAAVRDVSREASVARQAMPAQPVREIAAPLPALRGEPPPAPDAA
ncbi:MAG: uracil-DNA glycosylase, partial [Bradyrhizobium sp.]